MQKIIDRVSGRIKQNKSKAADLKDQEASLTNEERAIAEEQEALQKEINFWNELTKAKDEGNHQKCEELFSKMPPRGEYVKLREKKQKLEQ